MGFLDRLFGAEEAAAPAAPRGARRLDDDTRAVERYRYLLRTALPRPSSRCTPRRSPS